MSQIRNQVPVLQFLMLFGIGTVISISVPYIPIPSVPTAIPTGRSVLETVGNVADEFSNALCEAGPTGRLCNTSVATGHKIIQNLPGIATIRHCSVFLASPHCCAQFCLPGTGGTCDDKTGACFCKPAGVPTVCQMLMRTDDGRSTPGMNSNDFAVLDICQKQCKANTANNCTKAAAATDGIVGTICFCYCDPPAI